LLPPTVCTVASILPVLGSGAPPPPASLAVLTAAAGCFADDVASAALGGCCGGLPAVEAAISARELDTASCSHGCCSSAPIVSRCVGSTTSSFEIRSLASLDLPPRLGEAVGGETW